MVHLLPKYDLGILYEYVKKESDVNPRLACVRDTSSLIIVASSYVYCELEMGLLVMLLEKCYYFMLELVPFW